MNMIGASRNRRHGQVLILSALGIAGIIIATCVYTYQLTQYSGLDISSSPNAFVENLKLESRNLITGVLSNKSNGGGDDLISTLQRWSSFIYKNHNSGICRMTYHLSDENPYSSGILIDWARNSTGVSSAQVLLHMRMTNEGWSLNTSYVVDVTTRLVVDGIAVSLNDTAKRISVNADLYNEDNHALASSLEILYRSGYGWVHADSADGYSLNDFGNGTYRASFTVFNAGTIDVSVLSRDERGIFAMANSTCSQV